MKSIDFTTSGSVTSTLVFNNFVFPDVYFFNAQAGERIRLETSNTSPESLDTTIRVVGPNALIELFNDDAGDGTSHSRLVFTTANAGAYIVVVSSWSGNPGGGNYTLTLARGAAAQQAISEVIDTEQGKSRPEFEAQVTVKGGT